MLQDIDKRLYVKNVNSWKASCHSYLDDKELQVNVYDKGIILPAKRIEGISGAEEQYAGGVLDKNNNFIAGFRRSITRPMWLQLIQGYRIKKEELVYVDEDVIFGGVMVGHFGHCLLEGFGRLWYVLQHPEIKKG